MAQSFANAVYFCRKAGLAGRNSRPLLQLLRLVNINAPGGHPSACQKPGARIAKFGFDMRSHSD
ncbi:hypothetical protein ELH42_21125 [Rhizobium ruizarguesonis]|jgi:hypothetical protein|uniref:Uncharacterized protein n=1 Tax=Rhizobium ruizarguesonis TaxID=2081791 RepID=A0AB38IC55_9HYPH|nr:hypothetical protein ELH85_25910 [Rhizobium ruizarguesonis]TAZ80786.1 hypothetical protein ELH68_24685 [Rhizobium ruizarguesonis]TBA07172.1 hypothetical protein ELH64_23210 [Rhizobium ruizarguesonis]TBA28560.1 hypothetical protein ELH61_23310 [Rhizobium ruizarguesonis]TBA45158.1 hypothetical protein ELH62_23515 [Rhizobium ruizarguesonis]